MTWRWIGPLGLALMLITGACSSGGNSSKGPKTDAEWGDLARPAANRLGRTYELLDQQLQSGQGMKAFTAKCRDLGAAATQAQTLPPIPSGGSTERHFLHGLASIQAGVKICERGDANKLPELGDKIQAGFDELQANVGAFYLNQGSGG